MTTQKKIKPSLFMSFDIETDGNNPAINNMLSIGFYGTTDALAGVFGYSANLETLEGHESDPTCMEFWAKNQLAWSATQVDKRFYADVMLELSNFFANLSESYNLQFVAMPASFDWMFFKCYYEKASKHLGVKFFDIGFKCICISTYFDCYCDQNQISGSEKTKLKNELLEVNETTNHFALEDAKSQAKLYVRTRNLIQNKFL